MAAALPPNALPHQAPAAPLPPPAAQRPAHSVFEVAGVDLAGRPHMAPTAVAQLYPPPAPGAQQPANRLVGADVAAPAALAPGAVVVLHPAPAPAPHIPPALPLPVGEIVEVPPAPPKGLLGKFADDNLAAAKRLFSVSPGPERYLAKLFPAVDPKKIVPTLNSRQDCVEQLEKMNARREAWLKAIKERFETSEATYNAENRKDYTTAFKNTVDLRNVAHLCITRYRMTVEPTGPNAAKETKDLHERHEKAIKAAHGLDQIESDLFVLFKKAYPGLKAEDLDASFKASKKNENESIVAKTIYGGLTAYVAVNASSLTHPYLATIGLALGAVGMGKAGYITPGDVLEGTRAAGLNAMLIGALFSGTANYYAPDKMDQASINTVMKAAAVVNGIALGYEVLPDKKSVKEFLNKTANNILQLSKNYFGESRAAIATGLGAAATTWWLAGTDLRSTALVGTGAALGHLAASGILAAAEDD